MDADEPPSSDISAELQVALWGLPLARVGELRACLAGACIVCGAARRAEYNAQPAVRAAAGQLAGMVRALAYSALPVPDVAAAASAWWGQQIGVRYAHADRADHVLAHIFHCGGDGWRLRLGLKECGLQALAAVGAAGRHLAPPSGRPVDDIVLRDRDAERFELQLAGGIQAGRGLWRNNTTTPTPEPFTRPRREGRGLNEEAVEAIEDAEEAT